MSPQALPEISLSKDPASQVPELCPQTGAYVQASPVEKLPDQNEKLYPVSNEILYSEDNFEESESELKEMCWITALDYQLVWELGEDVSLPLEYRSTGVGKFLVAEVVLSWKGLFCEKRHGRAKSCLGCPCRVVSLRLGLCAMLKVDLRGVVFDTQPLFWGLSIHLHLQQRPPPKPPWC